MEKLGKYNIDKIFQRIYEISEDPHNNYTPFELCDEMLDKIPNFQGNILVMFNLEFLYKIKERINNFENVWFITPCEKKALVAEKIGIRRNHIRYYSYKDKEIKGIETMPKFDVVVGNPPYKGSLHIEFLRIAYNISKKYVLWIQPAAWLTVRRNPQKIYQEVKDLIENDIKSIDFINGNYYFGVDLYTPFDILYIDKSGNDGSFILENKITGKEEKYSSLYDINKWNDLEVYPELERKILYISSKDNAYNHINDKSRKYFVNLPKIRGHTDRKTPDKIFLDDFYTAFPRGYGVTTDPEKYMSFSFEKKEEARNFMEFLKTRWGMFCLSIHKNDPFLNIGLRSVPWLDWSRPWTEKDFEELIDATPEEKEFVYKNIPDYYGIAKDPNSGEKRD